MQSSHFILGAALVFVIGATLYFAPPQRATSNLDATMTTAMTVTSSAFKNGEAIPSKYTCDGENVSPPLRIQGVPGEAVSLVLIMDDPDVPVVLRPDGVFDHWVLYDIDPSTVEIKEGSLIGSGGKNGRGDTGYVGPCPPGEYKPAEHRYFFSLYALDSEPPRFATAPSKNELLTAISGHAIAKAELMGRYKRVKGSD